MEVLVGFMFATWLFTAGAVGYILWKYVYIPWTVMRKDMTAMLQEVRNNHDWVKAEFGLRTAMVVDEEEQARREGILRSRRVARQWGVDGG